MRGGITLDEAIAKEREMRSASARARQLCALHRRRFAPKNFGARGTICSPAVRISAPSARRSCPSVISVAFRARPTWCLTCASCPTRIISRISAPTPVSEAPVRDFVLGKARNLRVFGAPVRTGGLPAAAVSTRGKRRLMIAVGCTGGAHRSVAISEALGAHLPRAGADRKRHPPRHFHRRSELAFPPG